MLVLTRKTGDSVVIDPGNLNINITVLAIQGDEIRLGFEAPKDVDILRRELMCICGSHAADPRCKIHGMG